MRRLRIILLLASLHVFTGFAAVKPAGVFTDYTVLQQNEPVRIWGTASAGEKVTVKFAGQEKNTVTSDSGEWLVTLDPMPASSEPRTLTMHSPLATCHISNVVVGEVWLAGGQSNMQTTMNTYKKTTQKDIDSANDPLLRMITIPRKDFAEQETTAPNWQTTTPQDVATFSASAYYFAKHLRETLKVPVGIVACSVGGTPAEAWMSRKTLESSPDLKRILDSYEAGYRKNFASEEAYLKNVNEYSAAMKEWNRKQAAKETPNPRPVEKMGPRNKNRPCGLHENMLTQTIPYTVKGVIWYQGESNAGSGFHYRTVFSTLIKEWREEFQNKNLPFLFVQLASFGPVTDESPSWPELRESQSWTEENVKNTGMIVLTDGGEEKDIHPHSKDKVGYRLSLLARNMVYGEKKLVCRGPRLKDAKCKDGAIELSFKDIGSGLVLKPEAVSAFEICGQDGKFVPAKAELVKGKIIVSSETVKEPQEVRYGWKKWVVPTLFNVEGLPASPFRTDDFPPTTKDRFYLDGK
jgi:sialate O-acetylesterase